MGNIKSLFPWHPASASPHPAVPRAWWLAVRPAGSTQAARWLTRRSCLELGDRQQTSASHAGREHFASIEGLQVEKPYD